MKPVKITKCLFAVLCLCACMSIPASAKEVSLGTEADLNGLYYTLSSPGGKHTITINSVNDASVLNANMVIYDCYTIGGVNYNTELNRFPFSAGQVESVEIKKNVVITTFAFQNIGGEFGGDSGIELIINGTKLPSDCSGFFATSKINDYRFLNDFDYSNVTSLSNAFSRADFGTQDVILEFPGLSNCTQFSGLLYDAKAKSIDLSAVDLTGIETVPVDPSEIEDYEEPELDPNAEIIDGVEVAPEGELEKWQYTLDEDNKTITLGKHIDDYGGFASQFAKIDDLKLYGKYKIDGVVYDAVNLTSLGDRSGCIKNVTVGKGCKLKSIDFHMFNNPTTIDLRGADTSDTVFNIGSTGTQTLRNLNLDDIDASNFHISNMPVITQHNSLQHVSMRNISPDFNEYARCIIGTNAALLDADLTGIDFDYAVMQQEWGWIDRSPNLKWIRVDKKYKNYILNIKPIFGIPFSSINSAFPRLEYIEFMENGVPVERAYTDIGKKVRDLGDTTWQYNCAYTLDTENHIINVTGLSVGYTYAGCYIYDKAVIDGVEYETRLGATLYDAGGVLEFHGNVMFTEESFDFNNAIYVDFLDGDVDTSSWTDMSCMFNDCYIREVTGMKFLDTQNVRDFSQCFYGGHSATRLVGIDASHFDFSSAEKLDSVFGRPNPNVREIIIPEIVAPNCTECYNFMFYQMESGVVKVDIGDIKLSPNAINHDVRIGWFSASYGEPYDLKEFRVGNVLAGVSGSYDFTIAKFDSRDTFKKLDTFEVGSITLPEAESACLLSCVETNELEIELNAPKIREVHFQDMRVKDLAITGNYGLNYFYFTDGGNTVLESLDLSGLSTTITEGGILSLSNVAGLEYLNLENLEFGKSRQETMWYGVNNFVAVNQMSNLETFVTPKSVYTPSGDWLSGTTEEEFNQQMVNAYGLPKLMYDWDNYDQEYALAPRSIEQGAASRTLHSTRHWANINKVELDGSEEMNHVVLEDPMTFIGEDICIDDTVTSGVIDSIVGTSGIYTSASVATGDAIVYTLEQQSVVPGSCLTKSAVVYKARNNVELQINGDYGDHDWGEWEITTPAAVGREGTKKRVCALDASHFELQTIPALPAPTPSTPSSTPTPPTPPTPPSTPTMQTYTLRVIDYYDDSPHVRETVSVPAGNYYYREALVKDGYTANTPYISGYANSNMIITFYYTKVVVPTVEYGNITGVVRDSSNNPIEGANVTLANDSKKIESKTNCNGTFTFLNVEHGNYFIAIYRGGELLGSASVNVSNKSNVRDVSENKLWSMSSMVAGSNIDIALHEISNDSSNDIDNITDTDEDEATDFVEEDLPVKKPETSDPDMEIVEENEGTDKVATSEAEEQISDDFENPTTGDYVTALYLVTAIACICAIIILHVRNRKSK